jgi:hypothetical protein
LSSAWNEECRLLRTTRKTVVLLVQPRDDGMEMYVESFEQSNDCDTDTNATRDKSCGELHNHHSVRKNEAVHDGQALCGHWGITAR